MSLRLARRIRITAGWLVALAYLVCVASPGIALALGGGPAPCLADEMVPTAGIAMQDESVPAMQMDGDKPTHHHGHEAHHHLHDANNTAGHQHRNDHRPGTLPGPCCAMMCVSAIPVGLPVLAAPSRPISLCVIEADRGAPDNAPPLLYRPPIA